MAQVETLIHARWLLPIEPDPARVLEQHSIALDNGRITAVLPTDEARASLTASEVIELPHHALLPGLVNAHTHAAMSLMRGLADDLPLVTWLQDHIWPAEARFVNPEFVADGVRLAAIEMLRSGTTCFNDMYFYPNVAAQIAAETGLRASIGMILLDFPTQWAEDPAEYLHKGLQVRDAWKGHSHISTSFAPHAPYTVSDEPLRKMRTLADEMDVPIQMHVHETAHEVSEAVANTGERPLARLHKLGLLSPNLSAVHMTQLTDEEIELCAKTNISVVHCPESNLKLASGFCPVDKLLKAGVNLALGTDGAASNNDLDMFGEMRSAALLGKAVAGDASALPAAQVLHMATLGGARALCQEEDIGSLVPGKWGDLTAVNLNTPETRPLSHVISQLVYAAGREQVTDVWVGGKRLLKDRRLLSADKDDAMARAQHWADKMQAAERTEAAND
ncbi:MAG: TRZ/ATZ family hydrolase [Nevskiales bacterium]